MPFVCPATGEMALHFDSYEAKVTTRPDLVSVTYIEAPSSVTRRVEKWQWKEEHDLEHHEREQFKRLVAAEPPRR